MIDLRGDEYWRRYVPYIHPDSPAPFLETSPFTYQIKTPDGVKMVKSMLASAELALLFALAKDYWTGDGEIVDLGCLYGLTTRCLAAGVAQNDRVPEHAKRGRVHAYDLFLTNEYEWWTPDTPTLHTGSIFPDFLSLNRDLLDNITPCPGDLLQMGWGDPSVEILMIDAAKSWTLNHAVVSRFFPRLIAGRSIVIQQDYCHHAEYWCAITMEYFADRFERLDVVYGSSAVFLNTRPILESEAAVDLASLSPEDKKRLMDHAISKAPPSVAEVLKTGKAMLLNELGEPAAALRVLATVDVTVRGADPEHTFSGIASSCRDVAAAEINGAVATA